MSFEYEGTEIETDANGYLTNQEDWTEEMGAFMASLDNVELTDRHRDVINFLRTEYFDNGQVHPNTRTIMKAMSTAWGEKIKQGDLYALFPSDPSKQGGKLAGLPESRRKGGY
ncbi:TusE/DsrC/DsvC family sulfur relay protein [Profundibacter sp.]